MVKKDSDYTHVEALPLSTRDTDSLLNKDRSRRIEAFDVEFDVEDDILIDWQKHGSRSSRICSCSCCSCWWRMLPERWQEPPDCWWQLSVTQRNLIRYGSLTASSLLLVLAIFAIVNSAISAQGGSSSRAYSSSSSKAGLSQYQLQYVSPDSSPYCLWDSLYLPRVVMPTAYTLHINTSMREPYSVEGEVAISVTVNDTTPCVVLHAHGMKIHSVKLLTNGTNAENVQPVEFVGGVRSESKEYQQVVLQFPVAVPLPPAQPVLLLTFSYTLKEGLDGFYRSSFTDAANKTQVMAATQFESIAARKAFPCFDEPSFKATFNIKITAPPAPVVVLSNMPLSHTHSGRRLHEEDHDHHDDDDDDDDHDDGDDDDDDDHDHGDDEHSSQAASPVVDDLISYHFVTSPPMSTYLVAWVIGELAHVEEECPLTLPAPDKPWSTHIGHKHDDDEEEDHGDDHPIVDSGERGRRVSVKVWGTTDRASQFQHAKEVACFSLQTLEQLLQVPYALPKLDLVAIPNFAAGAMENWGLLTYRETALLVDDTADDIQQKYGIATTVAHETVHQWFGDLVTLDDWTELWLNEGFATYFEAVVADAYNPTWGYFDNFLETTTSDGLEEDSLTTSHPLTIGRPAEKLAEIDNWFDGISYSKGGAVLRMLRAWLNQGNTPMLGFISTLDRSAGSNDTAEDASQHLRKLKQHQQGVGLSRRLLSQYLDNSEGYGSSSTSGSGWWTGRVHIGQSTGLPEEAEAEELEQAQVQGYDYDDDNDAPDDADDDGADDGPAPSPSIHKGTRSNTDWWTKKSHLGSETATLQQQAKQSSGDSADASDTAHSVIVAPAAARSFVSADSGAASGSADDVIASTEGSVGLVSGQDLFLLGLRSYLDELSYGNSNYTMLWRHLEAVSGQPIGDMMSTWTLRRGYPIVSVSLQPQAASATNQQLVQFDQVPYHAPRSYMVGLPFYPEMYCNDWTDDPEDSSWWIPLAIKTPGHDGVHWHSFSNCSSNVTMAVPHNGWVLVNAGRYGFYRVNYTEPLWTSLTAAAADRHQISSIDLAGVLDDAYSLSLVRQLNVTVFLSLTRALGNRLAPERAPWGIALGWLQRMSDVLATAAYGPDGSKWQQCLNDLKTFVTTELTGPLISKVQIPGQKDAGLTFKVNPQDTPQIRQLRPRVLTAAGFLGHQEVMNQAVAALREVAAGKTQLSPDVAKTVYSLAVGSGDPVAYDTVRDLYEKASDAADEQRALRALARATTAPQISKTLEYALSPVVRSQDVAALLVGLAKQGGLGFNMTWEFILKRSDDIMAKYGGGDLTYTLGRPLNQLAKLFVDEQLLDKLKTFAQQQPQLLSPTFLDEANEARMINTDWLRFQGVDACAWLADLVARSKASGKR